MSQIDPKWIQIDDSKLTILEQTDGEKKTNLLSIRSDIILEGVSIEFINDSKILVLTDSEVLAGAPIEDIDRDMSKDFWIQVPDFT